MATITVTDLATALGTDARTTRKFLRSVTPAEAHPGKGSRWAIEKREVRSLTKKFNDFTAAQEAAKAARAEKVDEAIDADDDTLTIDDDATDTDD